MFEARPDFTCMSDVTHIGWGEQWLNNFLVELLIRVVLIHVAACSGATGGAHRTGQAGGTHIDMPSPQVVARSWWLLGDNEDLSLDTF